MQDEIEDHINIVFSSKGDMEFDEYFVTQQHEIDLFFHETILTETKNFLEKINNMKEKKLL